jgi:hypothetical protein
MYSLINIGFVSNISNNKLILYIVIFLLLIFILKEDFIKTPVNNIMKNLEFRIF